MASSSLLLSSAAASIAGLPLLTPTPTHARLPPSPTRSAPSLAIRSSIAPVASPQQLPHAPRAQQQLAEEPDMRRRRGIMIGAIAAALTLASNAAHAEEGKKKKKCPSPGTCVANPTASCCYGG